MPAPTFLVNQKVQEVTYRKDGVSPKGNKPYKLYTVKLAGRNEEFSYFQDANKPYLTAGMNLVVFNFTTSTKGEYTNHTINEVEIDPASQQGALNPIAQQPQLALKPFEPTYHPINESNNIKEISIFTAYAKDLFVKKLEIDKKIVDIETGKELSIAEICKQAVLCGKSMFNLAIGKAKPATKPAAQAKPVAPPVQQPEPVDVPNVPFDDVVPPPSDDDLPF